MGVLVALMWGLEIVDYATAHALDNFGIRPRDLDSLPMIFSAPLLHFGFGHLISNSIPALVLGVLNYLAGAVRWLISTFVVVVSSGLLVWFISPTNSMTAGASGVIYGWFTYLLVRGLYSKNLKEILIGVVVFVIYGSILWGVLPGNAGVSWQGHLGGAIGGIVAAWLLHRQDSQPPARAVSRSYPS